MCRDLEALTYLSLKLSGFREEHITHEINYVTFGFAALRFVLGLSSDYFDFIQSSILTEIYR